MHAAAFKPRWANRDLLWIAFHYPFVQLGYKKVFARVHVANTDALKLNLHLGFKEATRLTGVYPMIERPDDGDLVIMEMTREECRWLTIQPRVISANHRGY
jgi:RimJ/RimL family protein N-acetyltransferase